MRRRKHKPARRKVAELSEAERGAVGEMLALLDMLLESDANRPEDRLKMLIAVHTERIAEILRNGGLHPVDDRILEAFVNVWEADTPARFNP